MVPHPEAEAGRFWVCDRPLLRAMRARRLVTLRFINVMPARRHFNHGFSAIGGLELF